MLKKYPSLSPEKQAKICREATEWYIDDNEWSDCREFCPYEEDSDAYNLWCDECHALRAMDDVDAMGR